MSLLRLSLSDFRSYADQLLVPRPGLVVLTGDNGAGKTNVLEAISLLSPGRGLRGATLPEMARVGGAGGFAVAARLDGPGGEVDIGTGSTAAAPERRQVRINGASAAANSLGDWLSVLWLTPAMDRLFTEGAGGRRRFLDRLALALHPDHARHAARYEAAMRSRNKLLVEEGDAVWMTALEASMAEYGAALTAARVAVVADLSERLAAVPPGPFARAALTLEPGGPASEEELRDALRQGRARDAAAGRTLTGPHRADLTVTHVDKGQPASRCSTGEQKALLLGIVLAHAELVQARAGRPLLLLLDEVTAHLDARRRAALFDRLQLMGGQVWLTGTDADLFDEAGPATRYRVADGAVEEA